MQNSLDQVSNCGDNNRMLTINPIKTESMTITTTTRQKHMLLSLPSLWWSLPLPDRNTCCYPYRVSDDRYQTETPVVILTESLTITTTTRQKHLLLSIPSLWRSLPDRNTCCYPYRVSDDHYQTETPVVIHTESLTIATTTRQKHLLLSLPSLWRPLPDRNTCSYPYRVSDDRYQTETPVVILTESLTIVTRQKHLLLSIPSLWRSLPLPDRNTCCYPYRVSDDRYQTHVRKVPDDGV